MEVQAKRRLVKSPPELWSELSDAAALDRHLGEFGEIRITRLEPESRVVWEGDRANGSVELDPAGWGTQVVLTVETDEPEPVEPEPEADAPEPEPEPEPFVPEPEPEPAIPEAVAAEPEREPEPDPALAPPVLAPAPRRRGFFARLFGWDDDRVESVMESAREAVVVEPEPQQPAPEPEPVAVEPEPEVVEPTELEPEPDEPEPDPEPEAERTAALLEHVLDQLGQAHHRPFSRA